MAPTADHTTAVSRPLLWVGLLGGAVAWVVHLIGAWVIAEFGCVLAPAGQVMTGLSTVALLVLLLSAVCLAGSLVATGLGWKGMRRLRHQRGDDASGPEWFMAVAGVLTSGLFAVVIIVQTVPIFFYLERC